LRFERFVHECPCCRHSLALIDQELGLSPHENISRRVLELVAWKGARESFSDASEDLRHCHGLKVSSSEVARIVHAEGRRVAQFLEERDERWSEPVATDHPVFAPEFVSDRLVVEVDGAVVLTREGEEHKTVWVARAFDLSCRSADGSGRAQLSDSRYAAVAGDLEEFKYRVDALANRMGARSARQIAVVADGAPTLWNLLSERLPNAVQIQDFWHVSEHLHGLAKDLLGDQKAETRERGEAWASLLWDGRLDDLIDQLEQEHRRRRGEKRERLRREIAYIEAGRHRMDYPRYREHGWPIGSGAVEGACKHLVKERLGITGARWKRKDLPHVLALRTAQFNNDWEQLWPKAA
jgi:hypothetical protein